MVAMPCTMVQKMTGAIIMRISATKGVAERLHGGAELRVEDAEHDADHDGDEHLDVEEGIPGFARGDGPPWAP